MEKKSSLSTTKKKTRRKKLYYWIVDPNLQISEKHSHEKKINGKKINQNKFWSTWSKLAALETIFC